MLGGGRGVRESGGGGALVQAPARQAACGAQENQDDHSRGRRHHRLGAHYPTQEKTDACEPPSEHILCYEVNSLLGRVTAFFAGKSHNTNRESMPRKRIGRN